MQTERKRLFWIFFIGYLLLFNTPNFLEARDITPEQPAVPMSQIDAEGFVFNVSSDEAVTIAPKLIVPLEHQGEIGNLFAVALQSNWAVLMDSSGWIPYSGEIKMFSKVNLGSVVEPFTVNIDKLIKAGESIDFFYGYEIEKTFFLGNALRFKIESEDADNQNQTQNQDVFKLSQSADELGTLSPLELPLTQIFYNCRALIPSIQVADAHVGSAAQLFAAIFIEQYVIVKTSTGWNFYNGGDLIPFKTIKLEKELSEFDLPLPPSYDGEVFYYYAYLVNRKSMAGNAMRVTVE